MTEDVFSCEIWPCNSFASFFKEFISLSKAKSSASAFFRFSAFFLPEVSIFISNFEINWESGPAITALIDIPSILLKLLLSVLS